jgi:hypothetical protein
MRYSMKTVKERENQISPECCLGMLKSKENQQSMHTNFLSTFDGLLSLQLLIPSLERFLQGLLFCKLIIENLSFG